MDYFCLRTWFSFTFSFVPNVIIAHGYTSRNVEGKAIHKQLFLPMQRSGVANLFLCLTTITLVPLSPTNSVIHFVKGTL